MAGWLLVATSLFLATTLSSNAGAKPAPAKVEAVKLLALPDGGSEVYVRTDREPDYSARVAQKGRRIIIDLRGAIVAGAKPAITDFSGVVGGVMTQAFKSQGINTTRVLVHLLKPAAYSIRPSAQGLRIVLQPADETGPMSREVATDEPTDETDAAPDVTPARAKGPTVDGVRFQPGKHSDRIIVGVRGKVSFTEFGMSAERTLLEVTGAVIPTELQRKLDTSAFGGAVSAVSSYQKGDRVLIDVDHRAGVTGTAARYGDEIHFVFGEGSSASMTGVGPDGGAARKTKHVSTEDLGEPTGPGLTPIDQALNAAAGDEWSSEPDVAGAFLPTMPMQQQTRRYTGRRIDVDLKDADIHNVLRILADAGRVNIVAADNVDGTVTIRLKNVPWDQALDTILQAKKLGMVRRGNIIRVAQMADLNKERELALERRKSELQLAPIETRLIPISYANAGDLQQRAKEMLSPRGSIAVDERTNVLIARDVGGNLPQIEELSRALDTQTPQVLIEARIVEATSRFQRDVGIQWGGDVSLGPASGTETGLAFPSSIGIVGGGSDQQTPTAGLSPVANQVPNPNFAVNLPATVGTGQGGALGLTFGSIDNTVNLAVRLSAAEATGMLRIVSSPRILTLDNHEARINQGTLIPFSQVSAQGVQTVFQEAKLQLLVVPHVTADGSVSMHVKINRDEPDFNQTSARGDPTILKREAETDLLVRDGHTAVIGGIYTRNTGRNLDQIPLLGDIPILGVLFQRRRSSDSRSELVIFLTPRIVNRAESLGG
ncbi:MAG: type IV pilus secretin PilQ [Polyangiaceae bacterium]